MKKTFKLLIVLWLYSFALSTWALDQAAKEETAPPAAEGPLTPEQLPPIASLPEPANPKQTAPPAAVPIQSPVNNGSSAL